MKTNSTRIFIWRSLFFILFLLYSLLIYAQPDYDFRNSTVISGTPNQVGAVYRFSNVKTGVDAEVTITDLTNGLYLTDLDGGGGFVEALQPVINIPPYQKGYAELRVDFFEAGTNTPYVQNEVPASPIDIDGYNYGSGFLYEFDMIQVGTGYVDFDGSSPELQLFFTPGWVTGMNIGGITYDGIDTAAKQVMFTAVNSNLSSLIIRVGADNQSASTIQRLRSVYFKKFIYANSILAASNILTFGGVSNGGQVDLKWKIADHEVQEMVLEKATTLNSFQEITRWKNVDASGITAFNYADNNASPIIYYRLKVKTNAGKVSYSQVLVFRENKETKNSFQVYPTNFLSSVTAQVTTGKAQAASFEVVNYAGAVVYRQPISLLAGQNNVLITGLDNIAKGQYITMIRTAEGICSSKVYKQ